MKKMMTVLLLSGVAAAAPSMRAPNLALLSDGGILCYDATAVVDGKESPSLVKAAEARLKTMLAGMGIKAVEFDAADECDRIIQMNYYMDNKGAPAIATADLQVMSYLALDNDKDVVLPVIWLDNTWQANKGVLTKAAMDKTFDELATNMFASFKEDYAARNKK